jgi:hypothetical protein
MPRWLYRRVFGHEWYVQAPISAEERAGGPYGDVFATVPRPVGPHRG